MQWTWNPEKAAANLLKHRVSFELAERALGDPFAISLQDPYLYEARWRTLGSPSMEGILILFVVHALSEVDEIPGRIISARKAQPQERRAYEKR
jgi:uncharacterized DUF497 family protein